MSARLASRRVRTAYYGVVVGTLAICVGFSAASYAAEITVKCSGIIENYKNGDVAGKVHIDGEYLTIDVDKGTVNGSMGDFSIFTSNAEASP
jgi:hypothetical protein